MVLLQYDELSISKIGALCNIAEQLAATYDEDDCFNDPSQLFLYHVYYTKEIDTKKLYFGITDIGGYFANSEPEIMEEVYERDCECGIVFYSDVWEDIVTVQNWLIDHFRTDDPRYGYNAPEYL